MATPSKVKESSIINMLSSDYLVSLRDCAILWLLVHVVDIGHSVGALALVNENPRCMYDLHTHYDAHSFHTLLCQH